MSLPLKILMLEDSETDTEIVQRLLKKDNPFYIFKLAMTKKSFLEDLEQFQPDLILADNSLPQFDAKEALQIVNHRSINIPFIMVTGSVSEEYAADVIKQGADDYILKDRLSRLPKAIDDALKQRRVEKEKAEAIQLLVQSEENLKAIFDSATEGFILTDTEGRVQDFNTRAKDTIFQNINEVILKGQNIDFFLETERKDFFRKMISKVLKGETIQYDRLLPSAIGKVNWINYSFYPVWKKQEIHGVCITGRNITERKIAEQQKEFEHNNLHALINNTRDLMWSVDLHFKLITSNHAFEELVFLMTGKKPEKGTKVLMDMFSAEQMSRYKILYERAFAGETFTEIEYEAKPAELWSEVSFYPIHEGNAVIGTACFSRNITQRKKAEDEIRISNERYQAVAKATSDAIWDYDFDTNRTYISGTGYKHLFGYNIVNDYTEPLFWESRIHPEDKERVLKEFSDLFANTDRIQSSSEYRFLKENGDYAYVNDRFFVLRENQRAVRILGAMQDITIRKKAEEEFKRNFYEKRVQAERMSAILNSLPANIVLLDEKGFIMDVNDAWKQFADENGNSGSNYFINENYLKISKKAICVNELDGKMLTKGINNVLKNEVKEFVFEYRCNNPGIEKWFRVIATPLEKKEYGGAVIMHIDISEIRRLERERLKSKLDEQKKITRLVLQAEEKERSRLGQELHDNISQLLAAIKMKLGFCLAHQEKCLPIIEECTEYVQEAITEARNLSHKMVLPRFEENGYKKSLELLALKYRGDNKLIRVETSKMDEKMVSDEIKETLYRIVQEQLNNIEKYARASEVVIQILTYPDQLAFVIRDNGIGFDTNIKSDGIGLTNILNRAESYNGSARIISAPGKGCSLFVEIPIGKHV